jgi:phage shock protein A
MTGFLQKLRVVTLGAAHDLLDKEIDANSPSAVRQYCRDLEDAMGKMNTEIAAQDGGLRTLTREYQDLGNQIESQKKEVKAILIADPNSQAARMKAANIVEETTHFTKMGTDITDQQTVVAKLKESADLLNAKHQLMVARVRELERLDMDTKAKHQAASALTQANAALGFDGNQSVDDVEQRMRRHNDVASAEFDRALTTTPQPSNANSPEVDALLASLK